MAAGSPAARERRMAARGEAINSGWTNLIESSAANLGRAGCRDQVEGDQGDG
jgi:hypothetical protein